MPRKQRKNAKKTAYSPYRLETINDIKTQNVYRRNMQYEKQVVPTTTGEAFAWHFNLNGSTEASTLSTLFDQYRVVEVLIEYVPENTVSFQNSAAQNGVRVISVLDFDDAGVSFIAADLLQYSTAQESTTVTRQGRRYRPTTRTVTSANGGFATADLAVIPCANPANNWVDISRTNYEWLGTKWWFGGTTLTSAFGTVYFKATVEFRTAR